MRYDKFIRSSGRVKALIDGSIIFGIITRKKKF